ncbi:MAG: SurA N-terminal domain-containing protein [Oscillospiraceae bacterium]|nr:SurA N-terminal domain-containing protein [Oscillospiraceae bacterium]
MKKETFNLVIRALIGVAASLIIVGAMGLITEAQGNKTFVEQASGLKGTDVVMTVDGEAVTAEEYLYMTAYAAQSISQYGITDLSTELGDGLTAADYVAAQAKEQVVASAALRAWAKEQGVALTEEDLASLQAQKDAYGSEAAFQQTLKMVGVTEELFDSLMTQDMLYNHLYEIYCAKDGAQRPSEADLEILAGEHKLVSAYVLVMDAAAEGAKEKMEDYAARLAEAENTAEQFTAFAAEIQCDGAVQTFDCCHSSPVNDALMALEVNGVSGVVEAEGALYVLVRTDLDLDTVAYVNFSEVYNHRVSEAVVEEKESVMSKIDVAAFYAKYTQLQQNAMASMAQG